MITSGPAAGLLSDSVRAIPTPRRNLHEALHALLQLLERERILYMVLGGFAQSVWGQARLTHDLDLSLEVEAEDEPRFIDILQQAYFLPAPPQAIVGHRWMACRYLRTNRGLPVPVDLFFARGAYQRQALRRAVVIPIGRRRVRVIAPEDLILYKLLSDRPIDRLDALAVIEEQAGRLDLAYLRRWAKPLGVTRRWQPLWARYRHAPRG